MAIKAYKPTSPGRRGMTVSVYTDVTRTQPERSLLAPLKSKGGRNNTGKLTVRHRGGGHKRRYRVIDFRRDKFGVPGRIDSIEYDPNRSARIALVVYQDGEKRYMLAPAGISVGDTVMSGPGCRDSRGQCPADPGDPVGHDSPQRGAIPWARRPVGAQRGQLGAGIGQGRHDGADALAQRRSALHRHELPGHHRASVEHRPRQHHGRARPDACAGMGKRPSVRGVAMDPSSHPHGGGEGRSPIGMPGPKTPWGKPALGKKTRRNKRTSKFIVRRGGGKK